MEFHQLQVHYLPDKIFEREVVTTLEKGAMDRDWYSVLLVVVDDDTGG